MRIWNSKGLAQDFSEGKVSSKDRVVYLFLTLLFWFLLDNLPNLTTRVGLSAMQSAERAKTLLWPLLGNCVMIIGFLWCYKKNKNIDDREFTDRFIAFSFLDGLRICIFGPFYAAAVAGLAFLVGIVGKALGFHPHVAESAMGLDVEEFLLVLPLIILWFALIRRDLGKIRPHTLR
jgi:hypothetical protein